MLKVGQAIEDAQPENAPFPTKQGELAQVQTISVPMVFPLERLVNVHAGEVATPAEQAVEEPAHVPLIQRGANSSKSC